MSSSIYEATFSSSPDGTYLYYCPFYHSFCSYSPTHFNDSSIWLCSYFGVLIGSEELQKVENSLQRIIHQAVLFFFEHLHCQLESPSFPRPILCEPYVLLCCNWAERLDFWIFSRVCINLLHFRCAQSWSKSVRLESEVMLGYMSKAC